MSKIGLCMIVKDEVKLITRCLDSVRSLVDYVLIQDTGSTDGTQEVIYSWLLENNMPGDLHENPWQNFEHNRSLALYQLRQQDDIDYAFVIDADDQLVIDEGFDLEQFKASLTADLYFIPIRLKDLRYHRAQLVSNRQPWRYRGVVHEFIDLPSNEYTKASVDSGLHIIASTEGARSRDPGKYIKDAVLLSEALKTETDLMMRSRYTFYLAQSWKDSGVYSRALETYITRAEMGGWEQEVYLSLYYAGQLAERLDRPDYEIIKFYLQAFNICPTRAEAIHGMARYCRLTKHYSTGFLFAQHGLNATPSGLFIEQWIYDYGMLDEYSINAYWTGRYQECLVTCGILLNDGKIPDLERVKLNASYAQEKLNA